MSTRLNLNAGTGGSGEVVSLAHDFGSVLNGSFASVSVPATGLTTGDHCIASLSGAALPAGVTLEAYVASATSITVTLANLTTLPYDAPAGTLRVRIFRTT